MCARVCEAACVTSLSRAWPGPVAPDGSGDQRGLRFTEGLTYQDAQVERGGPLPRGPVPPTVTLPAATPSPERLVLLCFFVVRIRSGVAQKAASIGEPGFALALLSWGSQGPPLRDRQPTPSNCSQAA